MLKIETVVRFKVGVKVENPTEEKIDSLLNALENFNTSCMGGDWFDCYEQEEDECILYPDWLLTTEELAQLEKFIQPHL
jgi:hypothetical protein